MISGTAIRAHGKAMNEEYAQASYEIWQRMAGGWDSERKWLWDGTRHISEWMIAAIDPRPGQVVLELAAGPGDTGFGVAERLGPKGRLISTDFSPNMVEAARRHSAQLGLKNVEHRILDAQNIDLEDQSVDAVLCRWGYMLMADPAKAFRETHRVLCPGGKLAFSVWGEPARNPWAALPARLISDQTGTPAPDPGAPGIFAMADQNRTRSLIAAARFHCERMETIEMIWRFSNLDAVWRFLTTMAGGIATQISAMSLDEQIVLRNRFETAAEPFKTTVGYAFPGSAYNTLVSRDVCEIGR
jgi:ubiquinone/menaquinone biosynthesis C-methylase UbiE